MSFIHLVCSHCHGVNRIPSDKNLGDANCGKCHARIIGNSPVNLSSGNFQRYVTRNDVPVVVDFWAEWCGPCKMMSPVFANTARVMEPKLRFAKFDTEAAGDIAARYGIRSIPTLIVFSSGREVARQAGAMSSEQLSGWINQVAMTL